MSFAPDDAPEMAAVARRAVRDFDGSKRFACEHVISRRAKAVALCASHPRVGLLCSSCFGAHIERHDLGFEFACDGCEAQVDAISGATIFVPWAGTVRSPDGAQAWVVAQIIVGALGLCRACRPDSKVSA